MLRLLPMSNRDKNVDILALRHQLTVLERQLGAKRPQFHPSARALLVALLHQFPMGGVAEVAFAGAPGHCPALERYLLARRHAAWSGPSARVGRKPCA
jgi:putative transposase